MKWTEADDAKMRALRDAGKTRDEAAKEMGRTYSAFYDRALKMKVNGWTGSPEKWTEAQTAKLKDLYLAKGFSAGECGKKMGLTRNAAIGMIHRQGWKRAPEIATQNFKHNHKLAAPKPPPKSYRKGPAASIFVPPPEPKAVPSQPIPALARPWVTRERGECAWPVGGHGAETLSCCTPTEPGQVYCSGHLAIRYAKGQDKLRVEHTARHIERRAV